MLIITFEKEMWTLIKEENLSLMSIIIIIRYVMIRKKMFFFEMLSAK
jgi:hypothetical protein